MFIVQSGYSSKLLCLYQLTVELVIFDQVCQFDSTMMGTNEPRVEEMEESYLFKVPFTSPNVDITIIAGKPSNGQDGHYPLLLLHFWNQVIQTKKVNFKNFFEGSIKLITR